VHRCSECDRLWREYNFVNSMFLTIAGNRHLASIQQDRVARASIEALYQEAAERRRPTRKGLKDHEATHDAASEAREGSTSFASA
jgi:hypothetical protein